MLTTIRRHGIDTQRLRIEKGFSGVREIVFSDEKSRTITDVEGSPFKGVVYLTPEQVVKALAKMHAYGQWLEREGIPVGERGVRMPGA